jgi:hypothetical protein
MTCQTRTTRPAILGIHRCTCGSQVGRIGCTSTLNSRPLSATGLLSARSWRPGTCPATGLHLGGTARATGCHAAGFAACSVLRLSAHEQTTLARSGTRRRMPGSGRPLPWPKPAGSPYRIRRKCVSRPQRPASPGAGCSADQSAARWLVTWPGAARLPRRHAGWSGFLYWSIRCS